MSSTTHRSVTPRQTEGKEERYFPHKKDEKLNHGCLVGPLGPTEVERPDGRGRRAGKQMYKQHRIRVQYNSRIRLEWCFRQTSVYGLWKCRFFPNPVDLVLYSM